MRNYFTRLLDENENIEEHFRNLINESFDGIYSAMGQKNLLRWVSKRNISDRIKKLAVEEFSKVDLEKHPNWVGFYTTGTNRLKLKEGHFDKNTATHELLHFFTDMKFTGETFPTFINEGLTEYLNREFEKANEQKENVTYTYRQNVDFVDFLHNVMGDSLIKAYLTGTSKSFSEEFSTYLTSDGRSDPQTLTDFYTSLNRVHSVLHSSNNAKTPEKIGGMLEKDYPKLRQITVNIISNAIRKNAHDLEYYRDGELDLMEAFKDVKKLTDKLLNVSSINKMFGISNLPMKEMNNFIENISRGSLTAILEESHVANEKIQDILNSDIIHYSDDGWPVVKLKTVSEEIKRASGNNIVKDLIDKRLGNRKSYMDNDRFNITSFIMDTSLILDKMNVDPSLKQVFLDFAVLRYVPQDIDYNLVKTLIDKHGKLYVALYQKQQENKRNVVDSKFVKISDTKFVEKRDNRFYFLDYDEKTGTFSENRMFPDNTDLRMRFSKETIEKFGGSVDRLSYIDRKTRWS